jgi:hypothetical protein
MKVLVVRAPAIRWSALLLAVIAVVAAMSAVGVGTTGAICARLAGDDPIPPDAQIVVVGTAFQTDGHAQNALIHVDEVWRGGPQPEWMSLIGTDDPNAVLEDSTLFSVGTRYLVVADREGDVIRPRGCGYTTPYSAALAAYRPTGASSPFAAARPALWPPGVHWWVWLGAAAVALLVALALAVWFRRRRVLEIAQQ